MAYPLTNRFAKRLVTVYNNLSGTNPIRIKDLLSVGLSVPVAYKVILLLVKENIATEAEEGGYKVDWEKFKQYLDMLIG